MKQYLNTYLEINMSIEEKIQELEKEKCKKLNEVGMLDAQIKDLNIQLFYDKKGLKNGQPFKFKGKTIVKITNGFWDTFNGFYLTKKGQVSANAVTIYIDDEITPM